MRDYDFPDTDLELTLLRRWPTDHSTIGELFCNYQHDRFCYMLEDRVREQKINGEWIWRPEFKIDAHTAIPSGCYQIIINESPRFKRPLPLLLNVPDFTGIRIHIGNYPWDTEGCLLPGMGKLLDMVTHSGRAFNLLFDMIQFALHRQRKVWISIVNDF